MWQERFCGLASKTRWKATTRKENDAESADFCGFRMRGGSARTNIRKKVLCSPPNKHGLQYLQYYTVCLMSRDYCGRWLFTNKLAQMHKAFDAGKEFKNRKCESRWFSRSMSCGSQIFPSLCFPAWLSRYIYCISCVLLFCAVALPDSCHAPRHRQCPNRLFLRKL